MRSGTPSSTARVTFPSSSARPWCPSSTSPPGLLWPILIIGLLFTFLIEIPLLGDIFLIAGLVVFGGSLIFSLVTLPVEFNASSRAYRTLIDNQILSVQEANLSKKVLNAAALTYVASMVMALLNLLRFLLIFGRHNNR